MFCRQQPYPLNTYGEIRLKSDRFPALVSTRECHGELTVSKGLVFLLAFLRSAYLGKHRLIAELRHTSQFLCRFKFTVHIKKSVGGFLCQHLRCVALQTEIGS